MALEITNNELLSTWTTLKVGGGAAHFAVVTTELELTEAVAYARAHALQLTILGAGSNVLVSDQGVSGLVLKINIKGVEVACVDEQVYLTVAAGETLDEVVEATVKEGYWGLENLSHIPGTVGATPVQNVGAYGVEVADLITLVRVFDIETESFTTLNREQCQFGYRDSLFKQVEGRRYIVTAVTFALSTKPMARLHYHDLQSRFINESPTSLAIRAAIIEIRQQKFPDWRQVGTAGSFFKNPVITRSQYQNLLERYPELPHYEVDDERVKIPLGWVLDKILGLRGQGNDKVGCYEGQALVVINHGQATAKDIFDFAESIKRQVEAAIGVTPEWEVTKIGF